MTADGKLLKEWLELWRLTDNVYISLLKRWNLSRNAYFVLAWLHDHPEGVEPAQLADRANIQRQLVTSILRDLESRELISRQEQKSDHRRRLITLTPAGHAFAGQVSLAMDNIDLQGLAAFTEHEQRQLVEYSRRFYQAIREL